MENTIVKEMPTEVKEHIDAIVDSEFDLDIRVFALPQNGDGKEPQAILSLVGCSTSCHSCSCSCATCPGIASCFTCYTCFLC